MEPAEQLVDLVGLGEALDQAVHRLGPAAAEQDHRDIAFFLVGVSLEFGKHRAADRDLGIEHRVPEISVGPDGPGRVRKPQPDIFAGRASLDRLLW